MLVLDLGVVPILTQVGATAAPALLAGLASLLALALRPRAWAAAARRRPLAATALGLALLALVVAMWSTARPRATPPADATPDWLAIGLALGQATPPPPVPPPPQVEPPPTPVVFRGGYTRTGALAPALAPRRLQLAWRYRDSGGLVLSSPAAHGTRVFAATCEFGLTGTAGTVFAVNAADGRRLWANATLRDPASNAEFELKGFFSSPAVSADGRNVVIGQGLHNDTDCALLCLDAATGALRWRVATPLHLESSPALADDLVVIGVGAIEGEGNQPIGDPGYVLAVDLADGRERWRHALADPESSPAICAGVVYIGSGFNGAAVVALRTATDAELRARGERRELWRVPCGQPMAGAIAVDDELVVAGGGNGNYLEPDPRPAGVVVAITRATGQQRWRRDDLGDAVLAPPALLPDRIVCTLRTGEVVALARTDGQTLWRRQVRPGQALLAGPSVAGQWLYVVTRDGYLTVLDGADGRVLEKHFLNDALAPGKDGLCISSPLLVGGCVYVGSETGGLCAFAGEVPP